MEIGLEHGEELLPLLLHYSGEAQVWDKDESTRKDPVWVGVQVNRKAVIFTDGLSYGSTSKQQWERDEFLKGQGFQPVRFSPAEVQKNPFACAVKVVELLTGKNLSKGDSETK
jgi:hypothetical protein